MKSIRFTALPAALLMFATWPTIGAAAAPGAAQGGAVAEGGPEVAFARWADIEELTYEMREPFSTGVKRLEARVSLQVAELTKKRATLTGVANKRDWDFAMKEMGDSQSYLKAMGDEMSRATPDTWSQQKEKVGTAWHRTQHAYDNVIRSGTG